MRVWLDDERKPPPDFDFWVRSMEEVWLLWRSYQIDEISFDHDLGEGKPTGYDIAKRIGNEVLFNGRKLPKWEVHSQNPVGAANIRGYLTSVERELARRLDELGKV